jgi:hypothetical protein
MPNDHATSDASRVLEASARRFVSTTIVLAFCLAGLCFAGFTAAAALRPVAPAAPDEDSIADGLVACPAKPMLVEASRVGARVDELREIASTRLDEMSPSERAALLERLQIALCALILQNPARALPWAYLLPTSPSLASDPLTRERYYRTSHDFGRLEQQAAYWRVVFAAGRWRVLTETERRLFLSDARAVASVLDRNHFVRELARLGVARGPEVLAVFRAAVAEVLPPEYSVEFDAEARLAARRPPG